jgi:hypothetical protein
VFAPAKPAHDVKGKERERDRRKDGLGAGEVRERRREREKDEHGRDVRGKRFEPYGGGGQRERGRWG